MAKVNLQSFARNAPAHKHYYDDVERSLERLLTHSVSEPVPSIPHPRRLIAEDVSLPPFTFVGMLDKENGSDVSVLFNTMKQFYEGKFFDLDLFSRAVVHGYPKVEQFWRSVMNEPEIGFATSIIENFHHYNKAPVVEYTNGLIGLLSQTSSLGIDKIPVRHIRSPYQCMYLNFNNAPSLPTLDGNKVVGAYIYERTANPSTLSDAEQQYLGSEVSIKRILDSGLVDPTEEIVCMSVLLISYPDETKHLTDGYHRTLFNFMFNSNSSDEISLGQIVNAHTGGVISESMTDYTFEEMFEPLSLVFNSIMYMNCSEDERKSIKSGTELEVKLKQVKNPKKARKVAKELKTAYDYIRIGKEYELDGIYDRTQTGGWKVSAHIRRGHFRAVPYGKGRKLSKIVWVMPTKVGVGKCTNPDVKVK